MAWIGALSIGLSLGLMGSGGSILTVPVLVFLLGEGEKVAIAESLAIVGAIAFVGSLPYASRGLVHWRSVLLFGVPGMAGAFLGAAASAYVSGTTQLVFFGFVMLTAAFFMLRPPGNDDVLDDSEGRVAWKVATDGLLVGAVTGFVGVGGGFLIVPALVLLGGLEMHLAVGTSLMIIALKSATGFVKYLDVLTGLELSVDWSLIAVFVALGTAGSIAGTWLAARTPQVRLRQAFAVFLMSMAVFVLYSNLSIGAVQAQTARVTGPPPATAPSPAAAPSPATASYVNGPSVPASAHMSAAAAAQGQEEEWIRLFNGRDLSGWTPKITGYELGDNFADTFRVEDGLLRVSYDGYDDFDGRFGHLFYERPFSHYVLRIEYRFVGEQAAGGPGWALRNSGVMLHGEPPEGMALDQEFPVSIEVQFLGGDGVGERHTANLCTPGTNVVMSGELITRHCTDSTSSTYPLDTWVTVEVEVRGGEIIRHTIDGETVLEYVQPQLDDREEHSRQLAARQGGLLLDGGTISLQSESHPIEFRRVELRELSSRQTPPIIQPGAPGQPSRVITAEEATDLSGVRHTEADVRFMQGMIHHHAQALQMTALVEERSNDEGVRLLAQRIDLSQVDEIGMMEGWLEARGEPAPPPEQRARGMMMPGMLSAEEMRALEAATGSAFDRLFLEGMIKHHGGALIMVDELFAAPGAGQESTINAFASEVVADQRAEMDRMGAMLNAIRRQH